MTVSEEWGPKSGSQLSRITSSWLFHGLLSTFIVALVFSRPPMLFYGDTDTARNYLNTIVSSLSTILALCISIILVAIQLAASNYTHRVLDFYIRLPYNISLFVFYLVTILHSFYLMAKIRDPLRDPLPVSLRQEMSADLVLVMICFVGLLLYMYAVVQLLKPERIIHLILRDCKTAWGKRRWRDAGSNIDQLCDIAKRAASVSDSATGTLCMDVMREIGANLPMPGDGDAQLLGVHRNLVEQWVEMVGVCAKEKETSLMKTVLDGILGQGERYVKADFWQGAIIVIRAYRHIVFSHLLAEAQYYYVESVATGLYTLALTAVKRGGRGQEFTLRTWTVIQRIGEHVFATVPGTGTTFLNGFLLSPDLRLTLDELSPDRQTQALGRYFQLWKAFAMTAEIRDAARFAIWWREHFRSLAYYRDTQTVAIRVALHLRHQRLAQTLAYVWGLDLAADLDRAGPNFFAAGLELLDGWPEEHAMPERENSPAPQGAPYEQRQVRPWE